MTKINSNQIPKFSILEIEKRWKISPSKLPVLNDLERYTIHDKYIPDARLRLRKYFDHQKKTFIYKIEKKYGYISKFSEPRTGIYLSENEFSLFSSMKGYNLTKERYLYYNKNTRFSIDVFINPNLDFSIIETEVESEDQFSKITLPDFAGKEVTNISEYQGFNIAKANYE